MSNRISTSNESNVLITLSIFECQTSAAAAIWDHCIFFKSFVLWSTCGIRIYGDPFWQLTLTLNQTGFHSMAGSQEPLNRVGYSIWKMITTFEFPLQKLFFEFSRHRPQAWLGLFLIPIYWSEPCCHVKMANKMVKEDWGGEGVPRVLHASTPLCCNAYVKHIWT